MNCIFLFVCFFVSGFTPAWLMERCWFLIFTQSCQSPLRNYIAVTNWNFLVLYGVKHQGISKRSFLFVSFEMNSKKKKKNIRPFFCLIENQQNKLKTHSCFLSIRFQTCFVVQPVNQSFTEQQLLAETALFFSNKPGIVNILAKKHKKRLEKLREIDA